MDFSTYAPVPMTDAQQRLSLDVSAPFELLTDEAGNQIVHCTFDRLPPYATKIIRIDAELVFAGTPTSLNPTNDNPEIPQILSRDGDLRRSRVFSTLRVEEGAEPPIWHSTQSVERETPGRFSQKESQSEFLHPEPFCESGDPAIIALAQRLRGDNDLRTAKNIFQWVAKNIRYSGYLAQPRGARDALEHRQGDCTEYMYLFMALCRAAGIPARGLGGYVVTRNMALDPAAYHNWAEFYADGRWRLADPQKNVFDREQTQYLVMRRIHEGPGSFRRFQVTGEGIRVEMR